MDNNNQYQTPSHPISSPQPGFFHRMFLMPFSPSIWREARWMKFGQVLMPLLCLALLLNLGLGTFRSIEFRSWALKAAKEYDQQFDPVVYDHGTVRVNGTRIPKFIEKDMSIIIDPEETIPLSAVNAEQYLIVRKNVALVKRNFQPEQEIQLSSVGQFFGTDSFVMNSHTITEYIQRNGVWFQLGILILLGFFSSFFDIFGSILFALITGALVYAFRGRVVGGTFGAYFKMGLALSAAPLVVQLVLSLLKTGLPHSCCLGFVVWPALMTILGLITLSAESRPTPTGFGSQMK